MANWTKQDIRAMRSMLESQWLIIFRPLQGMPAPVGEMAAAERAFRALLEVPNNRQRVVEAGIRQVVSCAAERYRSNCESIGNEIARFGKGPEDELVARFVAFAKENDADRKKAEAMLARVLSEGLPWRSALALFFNSRSVREIARSTTHDVHGHLTLQSNQVQVGKGLGRVQVRRRSRWAGVRSLGRKARARRGPRRSAPRRLPADGCVSQRSVRCAHHGSRGCRDDA